MRQQGTTRQNSCCSRSCFRRSSCSAGPTPAPGDTSDGLRVWLSFGCKAEHPAVHCGELSLLRSRTGARRRTPAFLLLGDALVGLIPRRQGGVAGSFRDHAEEARWPFFFRSFGLDLGWGRVHRILPFKKATRLRSQYPTDGQPCLWGGSTWFT
jgi:hypothetical protein